ncbi:protein BLISTER-like [Zingiber officinale]|uniref:protein BLISTER-like n=1 Tax=Zingiber officinale TaxID=94328 RepID=UPI001C4B8AFA|nr:protein BLISTER-like [Zingiber officinale]
MASAKVISSSVASSRKQGHLELGKKKLEEFRKKKTAKQVASAGQLQSAESDQYLDTSKSNQHNGEKSVMDRNGKNVAETSGTTMPSEDKIVISSSSSDVDSSKEKFVSSSSLNFSNHGLQNNSVQDINDRASKSQENSTFSELSNGSYDHWGERNELSSSKESETRLVDGFRRDQIIAFNPAIKEPYVDAYIYNSGSHLDNVQLSDIERRSSSTAYKHDMDVSVAYDRSNLPKKMETVSARNAYGLLSTSTSVSGVYDGNRVSDFDHVQKPFETSSLNNKFGALSMGGGRIADAISRHLDAGTTTLQAPESSSTSFSPGFSSEQFPLTTYGTILGRYHPPFLDSLSVPTVPPISNSLNGKHVRDATHGFFDEFKNTETRSSSIPVHPYREFFLEKSINSTTLDSTREKLSNFNSLTSLNNEQQINYKANDQDLQDIEFTSLKKDEDFAALEQHIDELTQDKFSLQRVIETSQALSDSLAAENTSLTDSFNQQGKVIIQLKSDIERLQEEIKAQTLALEVVKSERTNAQLECNAADERAKLLASEVINIEEKALRLRSNELKLEKELENLKSDLAAYQRKVSILEKECQDFQSTVDALQEEKKVLQLKLRKASDDGKAKDIVESSASRQDAATSTEDLDVETSIQGTSLQNDINMIQDVTPFEPLFGETSLSSSLRDNRAVDLPDASADLPQDQLLMIENIRALISELAVEKEELVQALRIESSNCSKMKELNKELSLKLEIQTQRLELLTAQRMANESHLVKPMDNHGTHDTAEYADEGDEVVERVLGWIMKLFPGGTAKRRTSKLL